MDNTTTPNDVKAAAVIANTTITSTNVIDITGQKTARTSLIVTTATMKAFKLPTTIDVGIDDKGTAATKMT